MINVYIDGGSRGNPGPAGYGVRVENNDGQLIDEFYEAIGIATNNTAEYRGLIAALEYAIRSDLKSINIKSDSQLLVKQMHGDYRVRHPQSQRRFVYAVSRPHIRRMSASGFGAISHPAGRGLR